MECELVTKATKPIIYSTRPLSPLKKPSLKAAEERKIETNTFIHLFDYLFVCLFLLWKEKTGNG